MIHLAFFITLFSLCTGAVSITISIFFYLQYRKRVVVWYTLLLGMVVLLAASRMVELYFAIIGFNGIPAVNLLPSVIEKAGYAIGLIAGPRFCFQLIGVAITKKLICLINGIFLLYVLAVVVEVVSPSIGGVSFLRLGVGLPLLFGSYLSLCIVTALKLDTVADRQLRIAVKLFFILSLVVFPLALVKYFRNLPYLPWHLENSVALFGITVGSIWFAARFFNRPTFIVKGGVSDYFRNRFKTTDREEEILLLAVKGLSNSAIGDRLCISVRTVESHLYNIFQKTGVKNRVQLINLLATNSAE
jgi:DNA-binding CsgD family transcriptional regulator